MKKVILLLLCPVTMFAQTEKPFEIEGILATKNPVEWVYLTYGERNQAKMDSVKPKEGQYRFRGTIKEPEMAVLVVKYAQQPGEAHPLQERTSLVLGPGKTKLHSKESLTNTTVTGSAAHDDYIKLTTQAREYDDRISALVAKYNELMLGGKPEQAEEVRSQVMALDKEKKEKVYKQFVLDYPNSPVVVYALSMYAGYDIVPAEVEPLLAKLPKETLQEPSALALIKQIEIAKKTAIGSIASDFTQNDTLGRPVSLSSFRGKYVLIDFWASWCGPCRKENPNVVRAFETFRNRNFTILGVSLDKPDGKEKWLDAIRKDGLTWTQVSDLKHWDNAVAKEYGIKAIPQNLLIDPDGRIIAKNLRGEELLRKLEEVLPK